MLTLAYYWAVYHVAGAEGPGGVADPSTWAQYGPATVSASVFAGIALVLFNMQKETLRLERERSARFETEVAALNKQLVDKIVPILMESATSAANLVQIGAEMTRAMQSWRDRDR